MDVQQVSGAVSKMDESSTSAIFSRDTENPSVCVVDGYGVSVTTSSGRLKVCDGIGTRRRERIYSRANHGLARLVVMAATGALSLEAIRWMEGAGVPFVLLDPGTGSMLASSSRVANDDARLRRAQALAPGTETGLEVARYLTKLKLAGEASIAADELATTGVAEMIIRIASRLDDSSTLEEIRQIEAAAAKAYWSAWADVAIEFVRKDLTRVPENWLRFEGRRSAINPRSPRYASDPVNAMLNYLYRLLEIEGQLASLAVGLDPALGVLHADTRGRASLVLDLIDSSRPVAERHVLRLIRSQPLRWRDFNEDSRGEIRVLAPLTHRLAEAMPGFATALAPVVESVAQMIAKASPYDIDSSSILTREKHMVVARRRVLELSTPTSRTSAAMGPGFTGLAPPKKKRQKPRAQFEPFLPLPICRVCGVTLEREADGSRRRGAYCPECLANRRSEWGRQLPALAVARMNEVESLQGTRPSSSPEANRKRRASNKLQQAAEADWEAKHPTYNRDRERYRRLIFPHLAEKTITQIAKATGISLSSASRVRSGKLVPHPRHWAALASLTEQPGPRQRHRRPVESITE
jgi:CRISPR-associated endonuclease Cas1